MMSIKTDGSESVIRVILENSEYVHELESQRDNLTLELSKLQALHKQLEYRFSCEVTQNMAVKDWCRANGVNLPQRFYDCPYSV